MVTYFLLNVLIVFAIHSLIIEIMNTKIPTKNDFQRNLISIISLILPFFAVDFYTLYSGNVIWPLYIGVLINPLTNSIPFLLSERE